MSAQDTIGALATEIGLAFQPLADAFGSPNDFATFMEQLGWNMNSIPQALSGVAAPAAQIGALIQNDEVDSSAVAQLLAAIVGFVSAVSGISSEPAANFPPGLDVATFKSEFPQQTLDYLVVEYLLKRQGGYAHLLKLAGIISTQDVAESATRPAFTRRTVAWSGLGDFFSNPSLIFQQAYNWGQPTFLDDQFLQNVAAVLHGWGVNYRFAEVDPALFASLTAGALDPDKIYASALQVPFFEELYSGAGGAFGLELYILPQTATSFAGFAILPYASGDLAEDIPLSDSLTMHIRGQAQAAGGFAILFRPNNPLGLSTGAPGISANFSFGLSTQNPTGGKQLLLGSATGSRLEYSSLGFTVGLRTDSAATSFYGEVSLADGDIVIEPGADADSFLTQLLPSNLTVDASITVGLDSRLGVYFSGSAGLEIEIPAHISLGPIEIQSATISIAPASGAFPISFGATLQGNLGPLQAVVDDVGLTINLTFPENRWQSRPGERELLPSSRPKALVSPSMRAWCQGGGYLYIDTARGEYAGALQLEIADFLSVAAIGLISTKMPDGSQRLLAAHHPDRRLRRGHPAQLRLHPAGRGRPARSESHRAVPAADGRHSHQLHPEHHVPAGRDCECSAHHQRPARHFPAAGWHLPHRSHGEDRMGRANADQPFARRHHRDSAGRRCHSGHLAHGLAGRRGCNSRAPGQLRRRARVRQAALLLLRVAVRFARPLHHDLRLDGRVVRLRRQRQFRALRRRLSSSVQSAATAVSRARSASRSTSSTSRSHASTPTATSRSPPTPCSSARIPTSSLASRPARSPARSGFDALIQFSPFHFIAEISTQFSVQVFGVGVYGVGIDVSLSGPTPWHVHGTASLSFFFFSIDIGIDFTWGDNPNTTLPPIQVMPILAAEAQKASNWKTALPPNLKLLVVLRQLDPSEASSCAASGRDTAGQPAHDSSRSARSTKSAARRPATPISSPSPSSGSALTKIRELQEPFAPSQFRNFDDATKLSQPAFVPQDSGIELAGSATLATATAITRPLRYDLTVIDKESEPVRIQFFRTLTRDVHQLPRGQQRGTIQALGEFPGTDTATVRIGRGLERDIRGRTSIQQPGFSSRGERIPEPGPGAGLHQQRGRCESRRLRARCTSFHSSRWQHERSSSSDCRP